MQTILLVDDDVSLVQALKRSLEARGYAVTLAHDGAEAQKRFAEKDFDVVVTDLVMPDCDGIELITELGIKAPGQKVIAISGGGKIPPDIYLKLAKNLGAVKTLQKPFSRDELIAAIEELGQKV